jgi:hypothetical protein
MAAVDKLRRWQHLPVLDDPPSSHGGEVEEAEYDASDEPSDSEPSWRALPLPHGRRRSNAVAEEALRNSTLPPSPPSCFQHGQTTTTWAPHRITI